MSCAHGCRAFTALIVGACRAHCSRLVRTGQAVVKVRRMNAEYKRKYILMAFIAAAACVLFLGTVVAGIYLTKDVYAGGGTYSNFMTTRSGEPLRVVVGEDREISLLTVAEHPMLAHVTHISLVDAQNVYRHFVLSGFEWHNASYAVLYSTQGDKIYGNPVDPHVVSSTGVRLDLLVAPYAGQRSLAASSCGGIRRCATVRLSLPCGSGAGCGGNPPLNVPRVGGRPMSARA